MDPDAVARKRRSQIERWTVFSEADAMFDDFQAEAQAADIKRQMGG